MAKKKLNKKIAIVGTLTVVVLLGACAFALLAVTRNPAKYLAMGDDAMAKEQYQDAKRYYGKAYGFSKDQDKKNDVLFKLAELYKKTDEWDKSVGCWNKVALSDKSNVPARENLLSYYYDYCDSAGFTGNVWNNVVATAGELIAVKPSAELYLKKGRGELEIGKAGGIVDQDKKIDEAIADLKKARELSPKMTDAYEYLFQAYVLKSEQSRQKGVSKERVDEALAQAAKVADEAMKAAPEDPSGSVSKLLLKLSVAEDPKQAEALAPDVQALVTQYPKSPAAYSMLIRYYSSRPSFFAKNIDKVVETGQKLFELEPTANNAMILCDSYYRRAYLHNDVKDIDAAIDMARKGLELPDAKVSSGPRAEGNKRARRLPLNSYLAVCYIDKALQWDTAGSKEYVKEADIAVNNMEQIFGSGDNHYVLMWHGILAYAMGQKAEGEKRMYAAYSQFKAADEWNVQSAQVAYWLASAFANSDETGALFEFLTNAIKGNRGNKGTVKPDLVLDFADTALELRLGEYAVSILDQYEATYGQTERSQQIRLQADLASGKTDDAAKVLEKMPGGSASTLKLRLQVIDAEARAAGLGSDVADANGSNTATAKAEAEVAKYIEKRIDVLNKLLAVSPKDVEAVQLLGAANYLAGKGSTDAAVKMVDAAIAARPDDTALQLLKMRLTEPNPSAITPERAKEMTLKVLGDIKDPYARAMALGSYYASAKDAAAASAQYSKALEVKPNDVAAVSAAFDQAVQANDLTRAAQLVQLAKKADLDECKGQLYEARQAMQEKKYDIALPLLDRCIEQRPVSSLAYLFRSDVKDKLGRESESIADAEQAATLNPLGMQVTRQLAMLLGKRNEKLGDRTTPDQVQQARDALIRAVAANPNDTALLTLYVQGLRADRPEIAFANMQRIYKVAPTSDNAVRLAGMALQISRTEQDLNRKAGLLQIAGTTLEAAYKKDPASKSVVQGYAEYFRAAGQPKADELIKSTKDEDVEWRYYLNAGQVDQAKAVLTKLYKDDPKNVEVLKGLVLVAERGQDRPASLEYSRKLIELEDSATTRLNLIQMYVNYNMSAEAYKELDSFSAKYPDDYRGDLLRALTLMNEGKYAEARELTNKVLQKNQNDAGAWRLRGELDSRLGDVPQAIASLQKSKLITDSAIIRISLAQAFLADGRENEAIEELRGALAMEQGPLDATSMLERVYASTGRVNELRGLYEGVLKMYPTNYIWLGKMANMYSQLGEKDKAIDYFRRSWRSSEEAGTPSGMALNGWLMGLIDSGQYSDVIAFGAKYTEGNLWPVAYVNMAVAAYKNSDKASSMRYFENALQKSVQDSASAFTIIDRMYNTIGETEAVAWCNQRLQKDSKDIIANIAMYNMLLRMGKAEDARKYGATIVGIVGPKSDGGLAYRTNDTDMLLRMYLGTRDAGMRSEAITELDALAADLQDRPAPLAKVLNNLAFLLADSGSRLDEATSAINRAFNLTPFDGNVLDTYAFVLYQKGQYKEAKERARTAIQMYEKAKAGVPFEVYERLGMITEKLGEKQEAGAAYKKAIEAGGKDLPKAKVDELNNAVKRLAAPGDAK